MFLESGTYGEVTLKQILQGKHMRRKVGGNISIHLALTRICFKECQTSNGKYKDVIYVIMSRAKEFKQLEYPDQRTYKAFHNSTLQKFELNGLSYSCDCFQTGLKNQGRFYNNYMKMVEIMLTFIRSSRESLWDLHLAWLH